MDTPQEVYNSATEALETIGKMANEMEQHYEEKIERLRYQVDDACKQAERYLDENEELKHEVAELIIEAQDARRSFTAFQLAVSLLIFAYGMFYGAYFAKCS